MRSPQTGAGKPTQSDTLQAEQQRIALLIKDLMETEGWKHLKAHMDAEVARALRAQTKQPADAETAYQRYYLIGFFQGARHVADTAERLVRAGS